MRGTPFPRPVIMKILIADDEIMFRRLIGGFLRKQGYETIETQDGQETLEQYYKNGSNIALVILDVMMPKVNGYDVCSIIRKESSTPVLILTAKNEEDDELRAFECGANDYISKPFSLTILLARVKNLIQTQPASGSMQNTIKYGNLEIDREAHTVMVEGKPVELTQKEFELLIYLFANKGSVLSREQILTKLWEYDYVGDERAVDTHIKNLRNKLTDSCNIIKTVRGYGYKIERFSGGTGG